MYSEIASMKIEMRNGMRQPYLWKSAGLIEDCVAKITRSDTNNPRVAVI